MFSVVVSLGAAFVLYKLARIILKGMPDGAMLAILVASLWFASPLIVMHSMNGLETGLYALVSIATLNVFANFVEQNPRQFTLKQMLWLGAMFGICFLVRNDAVFLIAAVLISRFILLWPRHLRAWGERIWEAALPGIVSLLIALPWLAHNYLFFGSIVPISGIAESLGTRFGQNFGTVPATVLEYLLVTVPIPRAFENNLLTIGLSILLIVAAVFLSVKVFWTQAKSGPFVFASYAIFSVFVIAFYGLYFGAPYFIPRFLSVLSPFLALMGAIAGYRVLLLMREHFRLVVLKAVAVVAAAGVLGLNGMLYRNGLYHQHMHVVDWVEAHVPKQTWVGAVQTGTLGFFHDHTINLDGKVNPYALKAALKEGGVTSYVLRSDIMYLADWYGIASWSRIEQDGFNRKFELIVADERANLAVLRRVGADAR